MPDATPLKSTDNAAILDAIRNDASLDYQQRIPAATQAGIQDTVKNLTDAHNRRWLNEFMDALVNRIGLVIARNNSWTNPLAEFKRGMLSFGSTIEEIQVGLLEAHTYDPDRDYMEKTLFGTEKPDVQTQFHTLNRQNFYKVSVNNDLLRRAFLQDGGLASFANQLMESPSTSDSWDEFLVTCKLFSEYERNGGFYHMRVPDISTLTSSSDDARSTLRRMRSMATNLQFLSTKYNASKMPMSARPEELVIFASPEFQAAIDVEALAGAFNIEKAEMYGRVIPIPQEHFGIEDCQAILTTRDFFVMADNLFETQSQWNPAALQNNYFLHHWQVISASRFVPAIMFGGQDDEVIYVTTPPNGVSSVIVENQDGTTSAAGSGTYVQGNLYAFTAEDSNGAPVDVSWSVTGANSGSTFITSSGVLHIGASETATSLTVNAITTWIDPSNPRNDPTVTSTTITVSGTPEVQWPTDSTGISTVTVNDITASVLSATEFGVKLASGTVVTADTVEITTAGPATVDNIVVSEVATPYVGYSVTFDYDAGADKPVVTYTIKATTDGTAPVA